MKAALPRLLALGIVITLLSIAGCASEVVGPEGEWVLESYGDGETPPAGLTASATFEDGEVTGSGGCNNYFGSYETDGSVITIGPVGSTEMWCEGAMDLEQAFLTGITTAETFKVKDGELRITYPDGVLTFSAR